MAHAKSHPAHQRTTVKPKPKVGPKKRRLCLAHGVPDHYFDSSDSGERFCKACRERMHVNPSGEHVWAWPLAGRLI